MQTFKIFEKKTQNFNVEVKWYIPFSSATAGK